MTVVIYQRIARKFEVDVPTIEEAKQWLDDWLVEGAPQDAPKLRLLLEDMSIGPNPDDPWQTLKQYDQS